MKISGVAVQSVKRSWLAVVVGGEGNGNFKAGRVSDALWRQINQFTLSQ